MNALIKKVHMYAGLLNFSILFVFGVAGLSATLGTRPPIQRLDQAVEQFVAFTPPPNSTDKQIADAVYDHLKPSLTRAPPAPALHRDADKNLSFNFFSPNGIIAITVLEKENRLRVRTLKNNAGRFMNALHTATIQNQAAKSDLRMRLWTYYNEFAIWSLLAMALSGVYLWLASRPGYRLAQYAFAGGCAVFIALYAMTR
jgi:hypothetical protein